MKSRKVRLRFAVVVFVCLSTAACDDDDPSPEIETSAMRARFVARSTGGEKTRVIAELLAEDGNSFFLDHVNLNRGDKLITTSIEPVGLDEQEKRLAERDTGLEGNRFYAARFGGIEKDTAFELVFDRSATGQTSAGVSTTSLPSPFELDWVSDPVTLTPAPRPFSRSSDTPYFVVWNPFGAPDFEPGDQLSFSVTGNCIETFSGTIDWPGGEEALQLTQVLEDRDPPRDGESCKLRVELTLRRTGTVAAEYEGGTFHGEQVRVMHLSSRP
jgi:hypothetical protein